MDAEQDIKPLFLPIPINSIPGGHSGFSAFQLLAPAPAAAAASLDQRGTRGAAAVQRQQHQQQQEAVICVLNRAASQPPEEEGEGGGGGDLRRRPGESRVGDSAHRPSLEAAVPPRISKRFWSAGEYDVAGGSSPVQPPRNLQNRMCVHPKFLHSNATSHKWPFGAVAELLDNAVDEIKTGATRIIVDKVVNNCNGSPALLVQDDGGGMDPDSLRRCMSFGYSDKQSGSSIGQYGNGFKTSTMRLGADAIVFSRCMKNSVPTQSIGLLSYTFLAETDQKDVVVPLVDYKYSLLTGEAEPYYRLGPDQFSSNLSVLLKWSPFATEEQLLQNFCDIGPHGTKILVFNLWSNDDGDLELDFDIDDKDIRISGAPKTAETNNAAKAMNESHLANQLRYSLRVYASVLYLKLPEYFKIVLRGQEVKHQYIASELRHYQCIRYIPQTYGKKEEKVDTTIGFLDGAPTISIHGFSIYHKNRLILPFRRVLSTASSKGRRVAGVLEADFIRPTHDKQDFEKSHLYQKLINRLKEMTTEYWDLYSPLIGYHKVPRAASGSPACRALVPTLSGTAATSTSSSSSEQIPADHHVLAHVPSNPNITHHNPVPIAFCAHPGGSNAVFSQPGMQITGSATMATGTNLADTNLADTRKRKLEPLVQMDGPLTKHSKYDSVVNTVEASNQICQYMGERELNEFSFLKQENVLLRQECSEFELAERDLLLKEQKLRLELEQAEAQYKSLLKEFISVPAPVRTPRR
ncbi:protein MICRORCHIDIA 6-like [Oryza brachyantha]|uniref:Morc S5 domain-containing protein n=1 Tax=Oryza brachyantha TaxID=4533 RepID=J3N862_ORYBR|nr:protein MICRORCHIDIA 6-like [Oryza brachyantha]